MNKKYERKRKNRVNIYVFYLKIKDTFVFIIGFTVIWTKILFPLQCKSFNTEWSNGTYAHHCNNMFRH